MENKSKLFKQRLIRVHSSVGIFTALFVYISIFFGIFTIFLPYIEVWEKPSRHFKLVDITKVEYSKIIDSVTLDPNFLSNNFSIYLPGYLSDPALRIKHKFIDPIVFDPRTMNKIEDESNKSQLAKFINHMHNGRTLFGIGVTIWGFAAVATMFLLIGGLIQSMIVKYKSKTRNNQNRFSKYHRKIFILISIPFLLIFLTGAYMNIGFKNSGLFTYFSTKAETLITWQVVGSVLKPKRTMVKRINEKSTMIPLKKLIKITQKINPDLKLQEIKLLNWKDKSAQIEFIGYNPKYPFLNGVFNHPSIILRGIDGSLVLDKRVLDVPWGGMFADSLYFLHLLFGVDITWRIVMVIIMCLSGLAIGSAVLLWLEKKAKNFDKRIPFYHWFSKLSLSIFLGIIPATAFLFILQYSLPLDINNRFFLQKGLFFIFWFATLTWSFYRISSYKAAKEFLFLGGILFLIVPFIHLYATKFTPFELLDNNMYIIFNVDLTFFLFGSLLVFIGIKIPINKNNF